MILERGDMFSMWGNTDLFVLTTNPIRREDGAVVMGRGIALEAKNRYPALPYDFGRRLSQAEGIQRYDDALFPVDIGVIGQYGKQSVGWFMVKDHWRENAKLEIIQRSAKLLTGWANGVARPFRRIDLNFPGIGNGKLKREDVLPIIEQLPDNVHVWEYA